MMDDRKRSQILDNYEDPKSTSSHRIPFSAQKNEGKATHKHDETHAIAESAQKLGVMTSAATKTEVEPREPDPIRQQKGKKLSLKTVAVSTFVCILIGFILFTVWYMFLAITPVTVFRVGHQEMATSYVGGGGILAPANTYPVIFPYAEKAVEILVKPGDIVKPNQPLVKLDPNSLNANLQEASAALTSAQTYYDSIAGTTLNSVAVAAALQALNNAKSHYQALQAQSDNQVLRGSDLVSTVSGIVSQINVDPGQSFAANTLLMNIVDQSSVIVQAKIPLEDMGQVSRGDIAQVSPSSQPNLTIPGTVDSILPQADPQTDTVTVLITVNNKQQNLVTGMSATVRIAAKTPAFVVPRMAVLNPDRESAVFLVRNGQAIMQQVQVAGLGSTPDTYLINSGISANDQIILLPLNRIHNGRPVTVAAVEH